METLNTRQREIVGIARVEGRVLVEELASRFDVSLQTIRKDLTEICARAILKRIHGGAVFAAGVENLRYDARRLIAQNEKRGIGMAAAELIPDNCSLFINIGTTTEEVAHCLLRKKDLLVITNNINVANILRPSPATDVIIAGGMVRRSDGGVVGETAVDFIKQFKVDFAIIGTSAVDEDGSLLDFDLREAKVAQAIIANAHHVILCADQTKLKRTAPVRVAHFGQINTFVTDRLESESLRKVCTDHGVRLIESDLS
ncbi:DeoR/GlpR family DNA-binding transcription regulator [Kiloniella laminariae]|uniref:DeoR/GlpR family DNA-binding transcription regulator n=1 Tax=Kiloniella laminariae TaxID=454162 RepID=UPI0003633B21|nr:DeoR/GlpR family DNA-binding transcription regulator [Kiloniella laminariae]